MPVGTRVDRCVDEVKAKGGKVNPYAVCQASTHQNLKTGKPIKKCGMDSNPSLSETNSPRGQKVKMSVTAEQLQRALAKVRR